MKNKKIALVDIAVEIDYKTIKKLDKLIKADKDLTEDEKHLWETVQLFPEAYCKGFSMWLEKEYGK